VPGGVPIELHEWSWAGWEELFQTTWKELLRARWRDGQPALDWSTPVMRSTWEAGPFEVSVEPPRVTEEFHQGPVTVMPAENGKTRVVYGPWQVIVRGLAGHAEKRVLARWEVEASWVVEMGVERVIRTLSPSHLRDHAERGAPSDALMVGSSGALGASERRWLSASDLRLRGSSEVFYAGASELRWLGASEALAGSERRLLGGSETRLLGASEHAWLGASEGRLGGTNEGSFDFAWGDAATKLVGGG
jgi:hypothetical protein